MFTEDHSIFLRDSDWALSKKIECISLFQHVVFLIHAEPGMH